VSGVLLDCSDTEIVDSNLTPGVYVCLCLPALCSPVQVEALCRADHSSKESHRKSKQINSYRSNSEMWILA
jgi:hypothetical protein